MHHRQKALQSPERYMCLIIDGMDQKKTCLPHFRRLPKDIGDECLVQMHLVGCLSHCQTIKPSVFITYPNIHNDPNLTVTVMQRVLQTWQGILPPVLYVQLDNTARENKNSTVFGYLSMLVDRGILKKIKVNFLLVGHTHDHIDQMFSRFCWEACPSGWKMQRTDSSQNRPRSVLTDWKDRDVNVPKSHIGINMT